MSGIIHVIGKPGAGKTSFVVAKVLNEEMKAFNENYFNAVKYILKENRQKGIDRSLPPERHVVSANFTIKQTFPTLKSYDISGWEFGCANPLTYTKPFIPYGTYVFDEAQKYFDSKGDSKLPPWVTRAFELHRHKFLTIYLMTQRQIRLHADIRSIACKTILIEKSIHLYKKSNGRRFKADKFLSDGELIKTIWHGREFEDGEEVDDYIKNKTKLGKPFKYEFIGDIREHYDPYGYADELDDAKKDFVYDRVCVVKKPKAWLDYKKEFERMEKEKQGNKEKLEVA